MKIIFLDVDGVLNGYNLRVHIQFKLLKLLFPKKYRYYFNIFGVHIIKVFILWIIVKLTGAKIVMTSSWRYSYWSVLPQDMATDVRKLYKLFKFFNINVIDITGDNHLARGKQIQDWFIKSRDRIIDSFIIIDDEMYDISPFYSDDRLLCTKGKENRLFKFNCFGCYNGSGLKFKHIKRSILILNTPIKSNKNPRVD